MDSPVPRLVALETDNAAFPADLDSLDRLSPRTYDTILAYYVRAGQAAASEILANSRAPDLSPLFLECLAALGLYQCYKGCTLDTTGGCSAEYPPPAENKKRGI